MTVTIHADQPNIEREEDILKAGGDAATGTWVIDEYVARDN